MHEVSLMEQTLAIAVEQAQQNEHGEVSKPLEVPRHLAWVDLRLRDVHRAVVNDLQRKGLAHGFSP